MAHYTTIYRPQTNERNGFPLQQAKPKTGHTTKQAARQKQE